MVLTKQEIKINRFKVMINNNGYVKVVLILIVCILSFSFINNNVSAVSILNESDLFTQTDSFEEDFDGWSTGLTVIYTGSQEVEIVDDWASDGNKSIDLWGTLNTEYGIVYSYIEKNFTKDTVLLFDYNFMDDSNGWGNFQVIINDVLYKQYRVDTAPLPKYNESINITAGDNVKIAGDRYSSTYEPRIDNIRYETIKGLFNITSNDINTGSTFTNYNLTITKPNDPTYSEFLNFSAANNLVGYLEDGWYTLSFVSAQYIEKEYLVQMTTQYTECLQEQFNVSETCGALDGGSVNYTVSDFSNPVNMFDGNLSTYADVTSIDYTDINIKYEVPIGVDIAQWNVYAFDNGTSTTVNLSVEGYDYLYLKIKAQQYVDSDSLLLQYHNFNNESLFFYDNYYGGVSSVYDVWTDGNFVYVAHGSLGLRVYNITEDGTLNLLDSDIFSSSAEIVVADDDFIYVYDSGGYIIVYEVSGSGILTVKDNIVTSAVNDMVIDDGTFKSLLVARGTNGLYSFRIDGATGAISTLTNNDQGGTAYDLMTTKYGDFVFLANGARGLEKYSINDGNINFEKNYNTTYDTRAVWIDERFELSNYWNVYIAADTSGVVSFEVNDISDTFTELDSDDQGGFAVDLWANDGCASSYWGCPSVNDYLYLANGNLGMEVYEYDENGILTHIYNDDQGGIALDGFVEGEYVYLANQNNGLEVYKFDPFLTDDFTNITYTTTDTYDSKIYGETMNWLTEQDKIVNVTYNSSNALITFRFRNIKTLEYISDYTFSINDTDTGNVTEYNVTGTTITLPLKAGTEYITSFEKDTYYDEENSFNYTFDYLDEYTVTEDVSYVLIVNLINEETLEAFDFNGTDTVQFLVECDDRTLYFDFTNSTEEVPITCTYERIKVAITYPLETGADYYRNLLVDYTEASEVDIYLIDMLSTPYIYTNFIIDDLLSEYYNPSIWVKKLTQNETVVIHSDVVDIENKIAAFLIRNHEYIIEVRSDNRPVQVIGRYSADFGAEKVISLYEVSLQTDSDDFFREVYYSANIINNTVDGNQSVVFSYHDESENTKSVQFSVYLDREGGTLIYQSTNYTDINSIPSLVFDLAEYSNRTIVTKIDAIHYDYGRKELSTLANVNFAIREVPNTVAEIAGEHFLSWFLLLILSTVAIYVNINSGWGPILIVGVALLFSLFEWFEVSITVVALLLLIGIIDVFRGKK